MTPPEAIKQQPPAITPDQATAALQAEFVHYVFDQHKSDKDLSTSDLRATNEKAMFSRLLSETPEQRASVLKQFRENDELQAQIQRSRGVIRDQVAHGSLQAGINEQMKLVSLSEKLNIKPLSLELSCLNDAIKDSKGAPSQELLDRQKFVEQMLAAPFMERVRLGTFELNNNQKYDAETMFKKALGVRLDDAVQSKEITDLRQAVAEKAHSLEVERDLPDLFRKNFALLAANSSKKEIVRDDLVRAANGRQVDSDLVNCLLRNYKMLNTMSHGVFDWSDGITQAGVDAYQAKYGPKIFPKN